MANSWYVRIRGKIQGPFTLDALKALRDRGQIGSLHEVSPDRHVWGPASSVAELYPPAQTEAEYIPSAPPVLDPPRQRRRSDADYHHDLPADERTANWPHSGLGIASLILGLISVATWGILLLLAATGAFDRPRALASRLQPFLEETLSQLMLCNNIILNVVGVSLGIAGVCQSQRNKVFAFIGLWLNGFVLVGVLVLFLVGIAVFLRTSF